jgi:hypothetical protein
MVTTKKTTKPKKNFVAWVQDVDKNPTIGQAFQDFLKKYEGKPLSAKDIWQFFHQKNYKGVSMKDCEKLANIRNSHPGKISIPDTSGGY